MINDERICPVLIVDDDNDLCNILEIILKRLCPVHVEHDLRSAEFYLIQKKPDIILLDNNLPDGLGVSYIKHILQMYPDAKIVLMTADASFGLMERAIHEGAIKFVAKPFRASVINDVILSICPELRAAS
jgi:DNA-binding NtrC family response regulator